MNLRDQIRVLVVDDMSTSRGLIAQALDGLGITHVDSANSAMSALQYLANSKAHLVISDYNMPQMDGLKFLHALRAMPHTKNVGFILVTGRVRADIIALGQQIGMNNYLAKPFQQGELRNCIEAVVGRL